MAPSPVHFSGSEGQGPPIALISVHGDPAIDIGKEEAGGQNVYVRQVGKALAKLGWRVDMFTRKTDSQAPAQVQHSPRCRTIRLKAGPEGFVPRDRLFQHLPEFVQGFKAWQGQNHYRLIHTNYWLSGWVGHQLRLDSALPWVHTYHSLGAVKYEATDDLPPIAETRLRVERDVLEQADCVVATSPQEQVHMRHLVSTQGNIEVIPCGTNVDHFQVVPKTDAKLALGMPIEDQVVLYVGRFDPRKGIETLIRAFGELDVLTHPHLRLVIAGGSDPTQADGAERRRLEAIVQELDLGDRVCFAGRVSDHDLPYYYAAADLCVVPSHYEPFGLVAIEAMACGTPVLASAVGGLNFSVVSEETGLLVPARDVQAFAVGIKRILTQPDWAQQLQSKAARRVRQHFSWVGVANQLGDLYGRLIQSHPLVTSPAAARRI
ncbi:MAG: glycosyltransferase [Nodosilinea sp.]